MCSSNDKWLSSVTPSTWQFCDEWYRYTPDTRMPHFSLLATCCSCCAPMMIASVLLAVFRNTLFLICHLFTASEHEDSSPRPDENGNLMTVYSCHSQIDDIRYRKIDRLSTSVVNIKKQKKATHCDKLLVHRKVWKQPVKDHAIKTEQFGGASKKMIVLKGVKSNTDIKG